MTVVVKKIGGSVAVVIPKAVASEMGLTDGTPLDITSSADSIIMRRRSGKRPRRSIRAIVAKMRPAAYRRHRRELPDTSLVGKEIW
jgi:antitoxin component of MazEF toxin-antitoxin module